MTNTRSIIVQAALTIAAGTVAAVPLSMGAVDTTVSALWGSGSETVRAQRAALPVNSPGFGDVPKSEVPAGCVPFAQPAGVIPSGVVVVKHNGSIARLTLDDVAARSDSPVQSDNVWVVGTCA